MKKFAAVMLSCLLIAAVLSGCGASMKDGTYRAEYDAYSHGYKEFVELTVKDGKFTDVTFNAVSEAGELKTDDVEYQESMESVSGTYPAKFYPELAQKLEDTQDIDKVDKVAGATNSTVSFKTLVKALLKENVKNGDSTTLVVESETEG